MDSTLTPPSFLLPFIAAFLLLSITPALSSLPTLPTTSGGPINSNSVLVALLDSHYTEIAELVEKALLLQTLEDAVGRHNLTIFAPRNEALERDLDPDFRRFIFEPGNLKSLQTLLLFHFLPSRIPYVSFPSARYRTLSGDQIILSSSKSGLHHADLAGIVHPDSILRPDGIIHGIDRLLVPRSVQEDFNRRRNLAEISAILPSGAPEVDPRTHRLKKPAPSSPAGSPPALPIYDAIAPGPDIAPAPAPGPGSGKHWFDGHRQIKDFIQTLILYGGYNEFADILVNLTSLATEMGRLVSEGYVLTVLAPNDEAMAKLTPDQLSEPGSPEHIINYHLIPEYQTEESMYNAVRRFGKVRYDTLRLPHKIVAREADGSVKFGQGEGSAYLFDPDIYTDGRISVQGIDTVLFPPEDDSPAPAFGGGKKAARVSRNAVSKRNRGKLMELGCRVLGGFIDASRISTCE
ncbi:fasciclin-like arabinogalactan protein 16 [Phalaenopsis equestris]|uniref:fasciclin-like arabinogalactan protein 16 n=1 Tax=Phalaenopsis equestris TaxID=78828 RepID=UPI0009E644C5|nr:fasciclin-like arabinogalactan protein 16 [Phalaenopsis equestris]XP_020598487.1 fasciclin-like arabinogalactan protein 16 [Phalaenopsis equestris]